MTLKGQPIPPTDPDTLFVPLVVTTNLNIPKAYTPVRNQFGEIRGFQLTDGTVLKPVLTFERHKEEDDSISEDLTYERLRELGVDWDYTEIHFAEPVDV